jgi:hypothetical protein
MKIIEHLSALNDQTQDIFRNSMGFTVELGRAHHFSACLHEISVHTEDVGRNLLRTVSAQIDAATLSACYGLYRQAYSNLRLALEMGLSVPYFSANKLEHQEWLNGIADIKWATLIDDNSGVLSTRFTKAFFPGSDSVASSYRGRAASAYRTLSEFVHGNSETWTGSNLSLVYREGLLKKYFSLCNEVFEILLFTLSCRFLISIPEEDREALTFLMEELGHVECIREFLGGSK